MKIIMLLLCAILCVPKSVFAFTVKLKDGRVVEGELMKQTNKGVQLNVKGAAISYFTDEIESMGEGDIKPADLAKPLEKQASPTKEILALAEEYVKLAPTDKLMKEAEIFAANLPEHDILSKITNSLDMESFKKKKAEVFANYYTEDELKVIVIVKKNPQIKQSIEKKRLASEPVLEKIRQQALNDAYQKAKQN